MLRGFPRLPVIGVLRASDQFRQHSPVHDTACCKSLRPKVPHALTKTTDEARRPSGLAAWRHHQRFISDNMVQHLYCGPSTTAGYPSQPVRIVIPFAAGGATDVTARIIGQKMADEWGVTVIIENKPGATGAIAAEYVAKANPDGYTLLMGTGSVNSVFPAVKKNLPFDTLRDFVAVSNFFVTPNILVVHPSVPAQNVAEFIALLKAHPKDYNFASSGAGSSIHLSGELFKQMAGVEMVHVPYKGSAPAVADLLAGHVKVMFDNLASSWPYVTQGQLRALGVTGAERDPLGARRAGDRGDASGFRCKLMGRPDGAGEDPAGDRREDFRRRSTRRQDAGRCREIQSGRCNAGWQHAGAFRQVSEGGYRAVARRGRKGRRHDRVRRPYLPSSGALPRQG